MRSISRSGLTITFPDTYRIVDGSVRAAGPLRTPLVRGPASILPPSSLPDGEDELLAALRGQDFDVVDTVDLEPELESTPFSGRRRDGAELQPPDSPFEFNVDLLPDEDAVLLLEQDGMYSWVLPEPPRVAREGTAAGGLDGRIRSPENRSCTFRIVIHTSAGHTDRPRVRGFLGELIYGRIKATILKFVAGLVVGQAARILERGVEKGLVVMDSVDAGSWKRIADASSLKLPSTRPGRILLFVHGTFSSTKGSFGALSATPWGQSFLRAAQATYDTVIGFDHPTLSVDPLANADELLARLLPLKGQEIVPIDAVVFSRGALVLRSLIEVRLPGAGWPLKFGRVVFVGSANGGTHLAEPENWNSLLDLYTNLAVGAARALQLFPATHAAGAVLKEATTGLSSFVKFLASTAVTERRVPGLAAMEPDGSFIRELNETQAGQPGPAESSYFAVTSDFEPALTGGSAEPQELPARFLFALADGIVDRLIGQKNDLVVDTASMTAIDPSAGRFVKDQLDLGTNPHVYHTVYFTRPETVGAMTRWFGLAAPLETATVPADPSKPSAPSPGDGSPSSGPTPEPSFGEIVRSPLPASVDTDILVGHSGMRADVLLEQIRDQGPSFVVVRRRTPPPSIGGPAQRFEYAFPTEDLLRRLPSFPDLSVKDALNLHEFTATPTSTPGELRLGPTRGLATGTLPRVILEEGRPVGVLPVTIVPSTPDLAALAVKALQPQGDVDRVLAKRAMPTFSGVSAAPPIASCRFAADIPDEVNVGVEATVHVTVSRERIDIRVGSGAAAANAPVDVSRAILLRVIPKANFLVVGDDHFEIAVPAPEIPAQHDFRVQATHAGEGEVWVEASQGQVPLVTLALKPNVVETNATPRGRTSLDAVASEALPLEGPLHRLTITEVRNGDEISYLYELFSPELGIMNTFRSRPLLGSRDAYITGLYKQIEQLWITNSWDGRVFEDNLRAFGGQLFDDLFPPDLQNLLWKKRTVLKDILVVSTEPFIPWEIVLVKEPGQPIGDDALFLCQMGLVRWLYGGWPTTHLAIRRGHSWYVIPEYPHADYVLPATLNEKAFLATVLGAAAVPPHSRDTLDLLKRPGALDLLHFAGHGLASSGDIANAQILMEGSVDTNGNYVRDPLNATTVGQFANLAGTNGVRPIIFLNACQVGRFGYQLTSLGGFAQAFLQRGAGAFIGPLWSVGDAPAFTFTETFYETLLKDGPNRPTISESAIAARVAARAAGEATWLAYVVYAHPHARVVP